MKQKKNWYQLEKLKETKKRTKQKHNKLKKKINKNENVGRVTARNLKLIHFFQSGWASI